jgi:uncharacterized Fe-S center protein
MINIVLFIISLVESFQISNVYYTKNISSSLIVTMFKKLNITLSGNIGLKVHTGEIGGKYFLTPDFLQEIYDYLNGTFIECNTAYTSYDRHTTEGHEKVLKANGWRNNSRRTVIMDEDPSQDFNLSIPHHKNISNNIVGGHLRDFNSCLVLAHFKGHAMGGFGGALKQLSIGFASTAGKANIHSGGFTSNNTECWDHKAEQADFTSAMADAAWSIVNYFKEREGIAFINVMSNISTRCDCGVGAPEPKVRDLGILASLDPVAIDRASFDLIVKENTEGSREWVINSDERLGENTLNVSEELGTGSQAYKLICIDEEEDVDPQPEPESEGSNIFWYILIPVVAIILVAIGLGIFFICKKESNPNPANQSLGVSMTGKTED